VPQPHATTCSHHTVAAKRHTALGICIAEEDDTPTISHKNTCFTAAGEAVALDQERGSEPYQVHNSAVERPFCTQMATVRSAETFQMPNVQLAARYVARVGLPVGAADICLCAVCHGMRHPERFWT
jgi:hypothetical protein